MHASTEMPLFLTVELAADASDAPSAQTMLGASPDIVKVHATSSVKISGKLSGNPCPLLCFDNPPPWPTVYMHH